jgi:hypothetical protein
MALGALMNCFEWQNRSSDYLDGTLIGPDKREADEHLDNCSVCNERHQHLRIILSSIANQPRSTLPIPIRKAPFSLAFPKIEVYDQKTKWKHTPWFVRKSIEGLGITLAILIVVAAIPKIRSLYDQGLQRKLEVFSFRDLLINSNEEESSTSQLPLTRGKLTHAEIEQSIEAVDEYSENESEQDTHNSLPSDQSISDTKISNSEIWRFNLKTDSPHQIRPKIVKILRELGAPPDTPGIGGVEAPGGIQFNILISQMAVAPLREQLEKLVPQVIPMSAETSTLQAAFTWYKSHAKRTLPIGKSRVIIWLSQM